MTGPKPWLTPATLTGSFVRLEPLAHAHLDGLIEAVTDGDVYKLWYTKVPAPENMSAEIERRLGLQREGSMLAFTIVDTATNSIAGMTTYMQADAVTRRLEIGYTWYRARVRRTAVNTEAKLLLLAHAFDVLGCVAVEFRTSSFNVTSRRAIERLGAKLDGVLRSQMLHSNGTPRDTYVYSIIASEWPAVRANLQGRLART